MANYRTQIQAPDSFAPIPSSVGSLTLPQLDQRNPEVVAALTATNEQWRILMNSNTGQAPVPLDPTVEQLQTSLAQNLANAPSASFTPRIDEANQFQALTAREPNGVFVNIMVDSRNPDAVSWAQKARKAQLSNGSFDPAKVPPRTFPASSVEVVPQDLNNAPSVQFANGANNFLQTDVPKILPEPSTRPVQPDTAASYARAGVDLPSPVPTKPGIGV